MLRSASGRTFGIALVATSLLLTACSLVTPAAPTPAPAQPAASADGGGRGPRAGQGAANGQGTSQGRGAGYGQGAGNAQGAGNGQGAGSAQGAGNGQGAGAGRGPGAGRGAAADSPTVNGDVDTIDGRVISVSTSTGLRKVQVPDGASIMTEGKGALADLTPGALVGVTGKQDGTAIQVRIFGAGVTPRTGQFPMSGQQAGNVMTNAKIDAFDGKTLTVDIDGAETKLTVPPEAEVVKPVPATFADIKSGERIIAFGSSDGDTLAAQTVTILPAQRNGRG